MSKLGLDMLPSWAYTEFIIEYEAGSQAKVLCKVAWRPYDVDFPFSIDEPFYVCPDKKTSALLEVIFGRKGTPKMVFTDITRKRLVMVGYD